MDVFITVITRMSPAIDFLDFSVFFSVVNRFITFIISVV